MNNDTFSVYDQTTRTWLADDERSWSPDYTDAAQFTAGDLARDIGERERCTDMVLSVMQRVDQWSDAA